jgi:hypothetical protein
MQTYREPILNSRGEPVIGASVTVSNIDGSLAALFDVDGVTPIDNPVSTNTNGEPVFKAPNGTYSVTIAGQGLNPRSVPVVLNDPADGIKNMSHWGVIGNGIVNDTVKWQAAIDAINAEGGGVLYVNRGTYLLNKWFMRSNVSLVLSTGTILQCANNSLGLNERFINIDGVSNCVIHGNRAVVRQNNEYTTGEQRHNLFIVDAHNIAIRDLDFNDSGGDGYYIGSNGGATHCTKVLMENCNCSGNRRQGFTIAAGADVTVIGGVCSSTTGTSPQYGWDIEPNQDDVALDNITLIGVTTRSNTGGGGLIALKNFVNLAPRSVSISIIDYKSIDDNTGLVSLSASLKFAGDGSAWVNTCSGSIIVKDFQSTNAKLSSVVILDWDYLKGPMIDIDGGRFISPNFGNAAAQPYDKCGVAVYTSGTTAGVGNFKIRNVEISGTNLYTGVYLADTLGPIRSFTLFDVVNKAASTTSTFINYVSAGGANPDSSISYSKEQIVSLSASSLITNYPGQTIETTAGGAWTLPAVNDALGQRFIIRNMVNASAQVVPAAGEFILGWSVVAAGSIVLNRIGDVVIVRATTAGWAPEYVSQYAQRPLATNVTTPRKNVFVTAAPASGTWEVGDKGWNIATAVGSQKYWFASAAGTPGTWVADRKRGTFTCAANKDTTVADVEVQAASIIVLMPTNAAAATLMGGATSLYTSLRTAATSFKVTTANAAAAAGTETFEYMILN